MASIEADAPHKVNNAAILYGIEDLVSCVAVNIMPQGQLTGFSRPIATGVAGCSWPLCTAYLSDCSSSWPLNELAWTPLLGSCLTSSVPWQRYENFPLPPRVSEGCVRVKIISTGTAAVRSLKAPLADEAQCTSPALELCLFKVSIQSMQHSIGLLQVSVAPTYTT